MHDVKEQRPLGGQGACDRPATLEGGQALCQGCRQEDEDLAAFGKNGVAEIAPLRKTCYVAPYTPTFTRYLPGEDFPDVPRWRDYRVEILAFPFTPDVSFVPPAYPWLYERLPGIDEPCIVGRWRLRHPDKPGILAVSWQPRTLTVRRDVLTVGPDATPEDAARLMALWPSGNGAATEPSPGTRRGRGRPVGATRGSRTAFWMGRVEANGEPAARAEYNDQTPRGPGRYGWWDSNVLRNIRRQKHHR